MLVLPKRYYFFLLTFPIYPNNKDESKEVEKLTKQRTYEDKQFFELTDLSVVHAFKDYVPESESELNYIIQRPSLVILTLFLKYSINRARPSDINKNIVALESKTGNTPSYPAGHAFQAYCLANILSKKYPEKKEILTKIAERCDIVRVKAGIHYPSDGEIAKKIADLLYF